VPFGSNLDRRRAGALMMRGFPGAGSAATLSHPTQSALIFLPMNRNDGNYQMPESKPSKSRRSDGEQTRLRILQTAEKLFSIDGFSGVSLRQITGEAGVDLALIKYYFGSKEGLFDAVLASRVDKMSELRLEGLARIEIVPNSRATVEQLLEVFLRPMLGRSAQEVKELKNYRLLIALVTNSRAWQDQVFKKHYDPVARKFVDSLAAILPGAAWEDICWAFSFFLGSVVNAFAETGRIDRLSDGRCKSSDLEEACRKLVHYTTAAFMGLPRTSTQQMREQSQ
jgi:AcrR family transcriptional regulator